MRKVLPQAAKLPGTSGSFKKVSFLRTSSAPGSEAAQDKWLVQQKKCLFFEKQFCPRQRSCPGQVACSKKVSFLRNSSAPGSEAAPDKWLGREKANNRCSQGRGAPFGGSGGRSPLESRGVWGGRSPPPPDPQIRAKIYIPTPDQPPWRPL